MRTWSCVALALLSGCIVPRSMVVGQMAAPVGRGAADVGVFTGISYASQTNPTFLEQDLTGDTQNRSERTAGFSAPNFEANLQYGFNENVGLNVHASSAGIQPGVKLTVNRSKVAHFAILPQVAIGYGSLGGTSLIAGSDGVQQETTPTTKTSFTFLGGLKLLVSHKSGFYAGVGYDFLFNRQYNKGSIGAAGSVTSTENVTSTTGHQISAAVGMDIALGMVHLRPEVAFAVYPGIGQTVTSRVGEQTNSVGATGGFGWALLPGFTISITSPRRELTAEEEEEEAERAKEEQRKKKRAGDDDEEEEEEDDEVKRPVGKKKPKLDDEDDEEAPRRRRPTNDDDED